MEKQDPYELKLDLFPFLNIKPIWRSTMKMTHRIEKINRKSNLIVAFDVSKDKLNYYYEISGILKSKYREVIECYKGRYEPSWATPRAAPISGKI